MRQIYAAARNFFALLWNTTVFRKLYLGKVFRSLQFSSISSFGSNSSDLHEEHNKKKIFCLVIFIYVYLSSYFFCMPYMYDKKFYEDINDTQKWQRKVVNRKARNIYFPDVNYLIYDRIMRFLFFF